MGRSTGHFQKTQQSSSTSDIASKCKELREVIIPGQSEAVSDLYASLKETRCRSAKVAPCTHLIPLQGAKPVHGMKLMGWQVLGAGFDKVYKGMEALNTYSYEPLSLENPKITRINTRHISEWLYGKHLKTEELFDEHVGSMDDPIIAACNGLNDKVLHAFLVFWNTKNSEYNTFHIRQGEYYPEFMSQEETQTYFIKEKKRLLAAISMKILASIYGDALDTDDLISIYKKRFQQKNIPYRICDQNCMTFCLLSFAATHLDIEDFLDRVGLITLQSPLLIIQALSHSEQNMPALHLPEHPNLDLLPAWLR